MQPKSTKNIAIFASGTGTNAVNICQYFLNNPSVEVITLVCNKPKAKVIENIKPFELVVHLIDQTDFKNPKKLIERIKEQQIDLLVLAGFLWLIPKALIEAFPNKIINLHPALLPKYGGKGMYGVKVHQAVIEHKESESGITIHYVNEHYDEGGIIFQAKTVVDKNETVESLSEKIHQLEYEHFPKVIEQLLINKQF